MLKRIKTLLDRACGALSALALFAIMVLTLLDVSGRKLLNASIPGSLELTELLMVAVIFAAMPLVSLHGEHVVFDSLDPLLERWVRRAQGLVVEVICAGVLGGVSWLMWDKANQLAEYGDTTAQLGIAQGPFVHAMSVLLALTALVHLLLLFSPTAHHHPGVVDEAQP